MAEKGQDKKVPAKIDFAAEQKEIKKSLGFSIFDGSFYSVMDGFTTNFIAPYALFMNAPNIVISLLASVPDLIASFFQLTAIKVSEVVSSRKYAIVAGAAMQAFLWLPILMLPHMALNAPPYLYLLLFATLQAMVSSFINPLWRSMMGDLVDDNMRGRYFSRRNRITGIVSFSATFTAGFILQHFEHTNLFLGFGILFIVAIVARLASASFILMMYEKKADYDIRAGYFSLNDFIRKMPHNNYGKFVLFVCLFKAAVSIASPFFVVYMLKNLHLGYLQFTILTAAEILATFLSLRFWGSFNDEKGSKNVIFVTGFLIPMIPFFWLFWGNFYYLLILQLFSGISWGGFNLAYSNFIFDATTPQKRTRCVAYFNLLHGISVFIGASVGGLLLSHFSVKVLFAISGAARLLVAAALLPKLREMRLIEVSFGKSFISNSIFIKPMRGLAKPIPPSHADAGQAKKEKAKIKKK